MKTLENSLVPAMVLAGHPLLKRRLQDEMERLKVPACSIALIDDGKIFLKAYGATPSTLFQAGSVSKPIAAFGALRLVERGLLDLDRDINSKLTSWQVPGKVTLRQLLSHSSGFNVIGFDGYHKGDSLPTLLQILNGAPPANNAPLRLEFTPGSHMAYSGGGYTVVQQLIEDVTGLTFADFIAKEVFEPLGMQKSTMDYCVENPALAHPGAGSTLPGGYKIYPESAAAGLWSTPAEIATWLLDPFCSKMITKEVGPYGLGAVIGGANESLSMSHKGRTHGYACGFVYFPRLQKGAVVMTNADNGAFLVEELLCAAATVYDWPDFHPKTKKAISLSARELARHEGCYGTERSPNPIYDVVITQNEEGLVAQLGAAASLSRLYPEAPGHFFNLEMGFDFLFSDDQLVIVFQPGFDRTFKRYS